MHINLFLLCLLICSLPILNGIWEMTRCRRSFSEIIKDKKIILSFIVVMFYFFHIMGLILQYEVLS